jgi:hypothetical protein
MHPDASIRSIKLGGYVLKMELELRLGDTVQYSTVTVEVVRPSETFHFPTRDLCRVRFSLKLRDWLFRPPPVSFTLGSYFVSPQFARPGCLQAPISACGQFVDRGGRAHAIQ